MSYINPRAQELAQEWMKWHKSRRFFAPPAGKNVLAQFMPSPTREAPDAPLSAELAAFNLAIHSQDEQSLVPFVVVYCEYRPKPIKWIAHELGISRDTFYTRAHKTAEYLVSMTKRLSEKTRQSSSDT